MKKDRVLVTTALSAAAAVLAVLLVIAAYTGQWPWTPNFYNSYALQAQAWLDGRLDLGRDYSWLELAIYEGKYFVSFPPFPSYVLLPLVAVFGPELQDGWLALAVLLAGVWYAVLLYREANGGLRHCLFWVLFLYLGTGLLFVSMNGYVWFLAQSMCFTLSLMSLYYALRGKGGASLTLWACAVGCRPMVVLYFPLLAYILWRDWRAGEGHKGLPDLLAHRWYWVVGPCLLAASYMVLNVLRFGDPLEFGHNFLPEFQRAPLGQFSLYYGKNNLEKLLRLPSVVDGRLVLPVDNGVAFWLVDPLIPVAAAVWLWELVIGRRTSRVINVLLPLLSAAYVVIICCHRTLGGWQYGVRYLLDVLPYLFLGIVLWKPQSDRFVRLCLPVMTFGAAMGVIGIITSYIVGT